MLNRSDVIDIVELALDKSPRILRIEAKLNSLEGKQDTLQESMETMQAKQETMQVSMETMQVSMETMQVSMETMQVSMETMQAKQETMQASLEVIQAKQETMETSLETVHVELHRHGLLFEEMLRNQNLILDAVIPARQRALQIDAIEQTLEAHDIRLHAIETKLVRPAE